MTAAYQYRANPPRLRPLLGGDDVDMARRTAPWGPTGTWRIAFRDEFNGTSLDTTKWLPKRFDWGVADAPFNTTPTDATGQAYEGACFKAANVTVSGGMLHLTVTQEYNRIYGLDYYYASGVVSTQGKFEVHPGDYTEARLFVPAATGNGTGLWPAFWMSAVPYTDEFGPQTWPPETDIFEFFHTDRPGSALPQSNYHYRDAQNNILQTNSQAYGPSGMDVRGAWHVFGHHWRADGSMTFYIDGVRYTSADIPAGLRQSNLPQFLMLNLSTFRNESKSSVTDPNLVVRAAPKPGAEFTCDWVRVWRPA